MSTTPPVRDTTAILHLLQGDGIPFRRKGDNFLSVLLAQVWPENFLLLSCHQNISSESDEGDANSITKRIGGRTAKCRPNLDPLRNLGRDEALAGVLDRSRLSGTVHGIGVQLHSSARASGFGNPAVVTERIRSPPSCGHCYGSDCGRTHLFAMGQTIGRAFESVCDADVFPPGKDRALGRLFLRR